MDTRVEDLLGRFDKAMMRGLPFEVDIQELAGELQEFARSIGAVPLAP